MSAPTPYAIELRLGGRPVLVVGAGAVAARRIPALLAAGARLTVVAPRVDPAVRVALDEGTKAAAARAGSGTAGTASPEAALEPAGGACAPDDGRPTAPRLVQRAFRAEDVHGAFLVLALTDDARVNAEVLAAARARGALATRADEPWDADFWIPAVVEHEGVRVAVSSSGAAPSATARLRRELASWLASGPARFVATVGEARRRLRAAGAADARTRLEMLARGPLLEQLRAGDDAGAASTVAEALRGASSTRGERPPSGPEAAVSDEGPP